MAYKRRYDNRHILLLKGESQRKDGSYIYRWTDAYGKRRAIYATDLDKLRIRKEIIELNRLEGIKEPPSSLTVESLYETWKKLKRGIKATTSSNYVYVFESLIRPSFGKKRVIQVKRSTVRAFYISLLEERGLRISTLEGVHNVLQQVFQYAVDDDLRNARGYLFLSYGPEYGRGRAAGRPAGLCQHRGLPGNDLRLYLYPVPAGTAGISFLPVKKTLPRFIAIPA